MTGNSQENSIIEGLFSWLIVLVPFCFQQGAQVQTKAQKDLFDTKNDDSEISEIPAQTPDGKCKWTRQGIIRHWVVYIPIYDNIFRQFLTLK